MKTKTLDIEPIFKCGGKDVTYKRLKEKADELKSQRPEIKIGQIFTVEGKSYVIVRPTSDQQLADSNNHGHLVITLTDI